MNKISNIPPKGTSDWMPDEFRIRKYIFETWRKVCISFGYEEYLTPAMESAEVYRAKSGEDLGGKELWTLTDLAGRELSLRPEMTPSVTRMVTRFYDSAPKPIRLFSIANYFRNEKPQRGRNREFWQLNFDIFGSESINADIEILSMAIEILKAYGATEKNFEVRINSRRLVEDFFKIYLKIPEDKYSLGFRIIDKWDKLPFEEIIKRLESEADAIITKPEEFRAFMERDEATLDKFLNEILIDSEYLAEMKKIGEEIDRKYPGYGKYYPSLMRGLDYYDGMVFEVFDNNPENNRSMFGGGRYNGLASIFGSNPFPSVGCAPGDETTRLFLESWNLIPENLRVKSTYAPILDKSLKSDLDLIVEKLRSEGANVAIGLELEKFGKALKYADSKGFSEVLIFGENEKNEGIYKIKDMGIGEEKNYQLSGIN